MTLTLYQRVFVLLFQAVVGAYVEGSFPLVAVAARHANPHTT